MCVATVVCSRAVFVFFAYFFFFNATATTEIYTLSLHDALPISNRVVTKKTAPHEVHPRVPQIAKPLGRSEEHTSELQSRRDLVCRLLLEKKKKQVRRNYNFCARCRLQNSST